MPDDRPGKDRVNDADDVTNERWGRYRSIDENVELPAPLLLSARPRGSLDPGPPGANPLSIDPLPPITRASCTSIEEGPSQEPDRNMSYESSFNVAALPGQRECSKLAMIGMRARKYFANACTKEKSQNIFFEYFLPASQVIAIGHPFLHYQPGAYLSQFSIIGYILIGIIFLVLGLKLKSDEIKDAMRSAHVFVVAIISSLFITGSIVAAITKELPYDPMGAEEKISMFGPYEFRIGLLLYYSVPCTITAGIVLVAQAEGNLPMAGAIATVANVIGCYTTPILLKLFLANLDAKFDIAGVLIKLTCSILLPVIAGKLLQLIPHVPQTVSRFKRWISVVTSTCLAIMLWMKVSKAVQDKAFDGVKWQSLLVLIAFVLVMCLINICVNSAFSVLLCLRNTYIKVMLLMVSQKTLVMAVTLVQVLPETLGEMGLILVPCFVAHPTQILVFSFIAPQLKNHPFDFTCPRWMPTRVIAMCEWLNQNNKGVQDAEKQAEVIANGAANGAVIKDQPDNMTDVVIVNCNGFHNNNNGQNS